MKKFGLCLPTAGISLFYQVSYEHSRHNKGLEKKSHRQLDFKLKFIPDCEPWRYNERQGRLCRPDLAIIIYFLHVSVVKDQDPLCGILVLQIWLFFTAPLQMSQLHFVKKPSRFLRHLKDLPGPPG